MRNTGVEYGSDERKPVVLPELAELLPPLSGDQLAALKEDLRKNGCYSPIVVNEELAIVDGHNRQRLCEELGVPYRLAVFSFEDLLEAKQWALDTQRGRRNLDKWELGKIALKLKPELEARAKKNMAAGGQAYRPSAATTTAIPAPVVDNAPTVSALAHENPPVSPNPSVQESVPGTSTAKEDIPATEVDTNNALSRDTASTEEGLAILPNLPPSPPLDSRKEMAQSVGIGERTMGKVMQIEEHAPPVIKKALDKKELSINQGYHITKQVQELPEEEQEQAAAEAIENIEREKAEKELEKRNSELYRQKKIADQFSKTFSKVLQLDASEENVRIWTECCRMTRDEMGDMMREAREFAQVFTSIADILEQFIQERPA